MTTINIDFVNTQPTPDAGWNNADVEPTSTGVVIADLLNSSGENTGLSLEITSAFSGRGDWGSSSWPDGPQHGWPTDIWRDQWYTNGTATLKISGFDAGQTGIINIAGAGVHDNRDTDFNVTDGAVTRYNNSGDLKNPSAPVQLNFTANENGEIFVDAAVVVTFGYLTGLSLTFEPDTFDLSIVAARAVDGARNSAFPDGPTITVGDASLGLYTWGAAAELISLVIHTDGTESFGDGPNLANRVYDEFEGGVDGEEIDLKATLGEWSGFSPTVSNPPFYEAADPHSATFCIKDIKDDVLRQIRKNFDVATEMFIAYAIRVPVGSFFPDTDTVETFSSSSAWKCAWLVHNNNSTDNDMVIPSWIISRFWLGGNGITFSMKALEQAEWQWGGWNYWSCWLKADEENPDTASGHAWFQSIREGVDQNIVSDDTQSIFEPSSNAARGVAPFGWENLWITGWHRDDTINAGVATEKDSIYFVSGPNANARIVLADNADFTLATRATVCPHSSWSNGRVVTSLRKVSHANFSGLHVHLIKSDNSTIYVGQLPS